MLESDKIPVQGGINSLSLYLSFDWLPVISAEDKSYFFPEPITEFMKHMYKRPAVYRWNIYKSNLSDLKRIYIGEGYELCPERIKGYLSPGPKQKTNNRLNEEFKIYNSQGLKVKLEILRFNTITINEFALTQMDLGNKHLRRCLESLLIVYYQQKGFTLLNL